MDLFIVAAVSFVAGIGVGVGYMLSRKTEMYDGYCSECRRMFRYDRKWNHTCPHCGARIGIPPPRPWPRAKPIGQVCPGTEVH